MTNKRFLTVGIISIALLIFLFTITAIEVSTPQLNAHAYTLNNDHSSLYFEEIVFHQLKL